ncbi:MAG: hypothetical protein LBH13_08750 [Cellulomonadaceae bacterium]|nr:hypothetical protein [Cellulomonadaceae bacterium]
MTQDDLGPHGFPIADSGVSMLRVLTIEHALRISENILVSVSTPKRTFLLGLGVDPWIEQGID